MSDQNSRAGAFERVAKRVDTVASGHSGDWDLYMSIQKTIDAALDWDNDIDGLNESIRLIACYLALPSEERHYDHDVLKEAKRVANAEDRLVWRSARTEEIKNHFKKERVDWRTLECCSYQGAIEGALGLLFREQRQHKDLTQALQLCDFMNGRSEKSLPLVRAMELREVSTHPFSLSGGHFSRGPAYHRMKGGWPFDWVKPADQPLLLAHLIHSNSSLLLPALEIVTEQVKGCFPNTESYYPSMEDLSSFNLEAAAVAGRLRGQVRDLGSHSDSVISSVAQNALQEIDQIKERHFDAIARQRAELRETTRNLKGIWGDKPS